MSRELTYCYRRNEDILCKEIDNELYLVDLYRRKFMQINSVGLEIWRLLDGEHALSNIVSVLEGKFDCSSIDTKRDVVSFVGELEKRELVS